MNDNEEYFNKYIDLLSGFTATRIQLHNLLEAIKAVQESPEDADFKRILLTAAIKCGDQVLEQYKDL